MHKYTISVQRDDASMQRAVATLRCSWSLITASRLVGRKELVWYQPHVPQAPKQYFCTAASRLHLTRDVVLHKLVVTVHIMYENGSWRTWGTTARNLGRVWSANMRWSARLLRAVLRTHPHSALRRPRPCSGCHAATDRCIRSERLDTTNKHGLVQHLPREDICSTCLPIFLPA